MNTGKRSRRRRRGKRIEKQKVYEQELAKTWRRLSTTNTKSEYPKVILPIIRRRVSALITDDMMKLMGVPEMVTELHLETDYYVTEKRPTPKEKAVDRRARKYLDKIKNCTLPPDFMA